MDVHQFRDPTVEPGGGEIAPYFAEATPIATVTHLTSSLVVNASQSAIRY